jgi:hypothetical protein
MRKAVGATMAGVGGLLTLALLPFLAHTAVSASFVLLAGRPVPGWWWQMMAPIQDIVALPIVAVAFVIKMGPTMSFIVPLLVVLVLAAVAVALLWLGLRMARAAKEEER